MTFFKSQRFWYDVLGLAVSAALFYLSTQFDPPFPEVLGGIGTSLLFVALLDLFSALQSFWFDRKKQALFGRELVRVSTQLVYPDFVMNDEVATTLGEHNQQLLYQRPRSRYANKTTHRIDLPRVVASNDIRALLYVSNVFESTSAVPNRMVIDREVLDDAGRSFISFGLSSNDCTHLYLENADLPLVSIVPDGNGSELLRMIDGSEYRSSEERQFGLILRHRPDPHGNPDRRWFLIAGLGPLGTTAAAYYLSTRWRSLLSVVPKHDDFAAIVSTGPGSEQMAKLVEVITHSSQPKQ